MAFLLLILSIILSFTPLSAPIESFLLKYKKYISYSILTIAFFSLFLILDQKGIKNSGQQALATLWFILFLPICTKVFNLSIPAKWMAYRKEFGILMGMLAFVHSSQYFLNNGGITQVLGRDFWIMNGSFSFLGAGFIAFVCSFLLLMTSNIVSMKIMGGKNWKFLHKLAYAIALFAVIHVVLLSGEMTGIVFLVMYIIGKILEWKGIILRRKPLKNPA